MRPGRALDRGAEWATAGPCRHRISLDVWPHLVRAVSWRPIMGAGALAMTLTVALGRDGLPTLVPATAAAGLAYIFDDRAAVLLSSSPTSLARLRAYRLALVLPAASIAWVGVYLVWSSRVRGGVAAWPASLAFAALVAVVLAAAAVAAGRGGGGRGGVAAVPILLAVVVTGRFVPPELALFVGREHARNWAVVLAVSLAALVAASRDPAARRFRTEALQ